MRRFYFKMRQLLQNAKFITKYAVTHHSTSLEGISASSYIIFLSYCNDGIASDRFNFYDLLKYIVSYRGFQIQKKSIFISNNLIVLPCAYLEIHLRPCACNMQLVQVSNTKSNKQNQMFMIMKINFLVNMFQRVDDMVATQKILCRLKTVLLMIKHKYSN